MRKILSFVITTLLLSGCSTLEVSIDYDELFDFKNQKTFVVMQSERASDNTLFNDRVINAIESELELKNYNKVSKESADLLFVFHADVKSKSDIHTDYQMMGYRRYGFGGAMVSTTSTYNYKEGTLIVDALNPKTQKIVWRGIATKELDTKGTPKERTQSVNRVIKSLMEKFPHN